MTSWTSFQHPFLCAGKREWPEFRDWFASNLAPALNAWMGDVEVVYEGEQKLDLGSKYVFGYAPHGLFPIGTHSHALSHGASQVLGPICLRHVLETPHDGPCHVCPFC